jgi:ABC-type nitrate/sulfonate/bicarbonate transport system permease component
MARITDDAVAPPGGLGAAIDALRGLGRGIKGGLTLILILAAWEGFARSGAVSAFLLPPLSVVLERVWDDAMSGDLVINLAQTLYRMAVGFAISAVLGVVLGILIARSRATRWFFDPIISVAFPMPKIAFLPVFMLWFGLYDASKITMIVFSAIFPVVTATVTSTGGVEKELLWSARSLGASERRLLWEIILPAALPQILTGLQVALPVSMIVAVVTEILMGGAGIGGAMIQASRFADSPGVFAGIIEIAVAGYCFVKGISWMRRRLLVWHQEASEPSTV